MMKPLRNNKKLRHGYPFLMIDAIVSQNTDMIITRKNLSHSDPIMAGHFQDDPIFPGVCLIEFMAQSSGLLIHSEQERPSACYLAKVKNARFYRIVRPGDVLSCQAKSAQTITRFMQFFCEVKDEHQNRVASCELYLAREGDLT